jgi:hypothetical protein
VAEDSQAYSKGQKWVIKMKLIGGMNYREWQKRNGKGFSLLTKIQQKEARTQGYCNIGWNEVQNSWKIICKLTGYCWCNRDITAGSRICKRNSSKSS